MSDAGPATPSSKTLVNLFVAFAVAMCVKAFYMVFAGGPADLRGMAFAPGNRDNFAYVGLWLVLYAISGVVFLQRAWLQGVPQRLLMLTPFALYIVASALWAENQIAAVQPALMLAFDMVVAAALAMTAHPTRFLWITAIVNVALVAISLVMLMATPSAVISDPERPGLLMSGELFGAYDTKGSLGACCAMSIVILLFLRPARAWFWPRVLGLAVLTLGLLLSNSAGSLVSGGLAAAAVVIVRLAPAWRKAIWTTITALAIVWSLLLPFINVADLALLFGRSADLTGRTSFWPMAPEFIGERPFFGYGYLAFFRAEPYSRAWDVWKHELWFFTPGFHNTFLDLLIGLGLVGGLAYVALLFATARIVFNDSLKSDVVDAMCALFLIFLLSSATELALMAHNSFPTLFLFYCFLVGGRRYAVAPRASHVGDAGRPSAYGHSRAAFGR